MCGVAGILFRDPALHQQLATNLLALIQPLETRGPDSCGVALYRSGVAAEKSPQLKLLLRQEESTPWEEVNLWLSQFASIYSYQVTADVQQLILNLSDHPSINPEGFQQQLAARFPSLHCLSMGQALEIYKHVGSVASLAEKYRLHGFAGSHGMGHTRMATESVVNTNHCHPFTASPDLSIVHNGQISNYYKLRYWLEQKGAIFTTQNDSEVIARYIRYHQLQGKTIEAILPQVLDDIDGTYTVVIATKNQMALVRDKFAAKPAVIYESAGIVAIASEYRALLNLPHDSSATIREPDAAEINIWTLADYQIQAPASLPLPVMT